MLQEHFTQLDSDPVLMALRNAPLVEATPEENAAFEEAMADVLAGRTLTSAQIRASIDARVK